MADDMRQKRQIDFTQSDTKDVAEELKLVRRLVYPIDKTARLKVIGILRALCGEWEVKFPDIDPTNYDESMQQFTDVQSKLLSKMRKEHSRLAMLDRGLMKKVLGGGMDFGESNVSEDI